MASHTKLASQLSPLAYKIQVIDRVVDILGVLATSQRMLTLREISATTKLKKSTTHRLLVALLRHHLILRSVKGRYICDERIARFFIERSHENHS